MADLKTTTSYCASTVIELVGNLEFVPIVTKLSRRRRQCALASTFDGVLADFASALQRVTVETTGKNLFEPGDAINPPDWNWFTTRGYTSAEMAPVFAAIAESPDFWMSLRETLDCSTLRMVILDLQRWHSVYFVTARQGDDAKWQTEQWLKLHLGIDLPTVLISGEKGLVAKALKLDCYIDDNLENIRAVCEWSSATRAYLLNKSYNQDSPPDTRYTRVGTLGQFFDAELVRL